MTENAENAISNNGRNSPINSDSKNPLKIVFEADIGNNTHKDTKDREEGKEAPKEAGKEVSASKEVEPIKAIIPEVIKGTQNGNFRGTRTRKLNQREYNFILTYITKPNLKLYEVYREAGYSSKGNNESDTVLASQILAKPKIANEIEAKRKILEVTATQNYMKQFESLAPKALIGLEDLMASPKDYAKLGAIKEVLDRIVPKVTRHQTMKVTVNAKEMQRRRELLDNE